MRIWATIGLAGGIAVASAASARAEGNCRLGNQVYPENAAVCSQGLSLYCVNGTWQNNQGTRCNAASGSYLSPLRPYRPRNDEPIPEYELQKNPALRNP